MMCIHLFEISDPSTHGNQGGEVAVEEVVIVGGKDAQIQLVMLFHVLMMEEVVLMVMVSGYQDVLVGVVEEEEGVVQGVGMMGYTDMIMMTLIFQKPLLAQQLVVAGVDVLTPMVLLYPVRMG